MYLKFVNFGGNMIENNLDGKSKDIINSNIDLLKGIFPEIFEENKISFEKLKLILGEDINNENERYSFTWPGKTSAIKESQKQSRGTLRPNYEESRNWNTTKNIYIEGDNLEVLKLLQKGYYNKIKAIYIDPPYNTGNDFVYSDNYKDNLENYLKFSGQVIEDGEDMLKLSTNSDSNGRFHSNWLNMMYPRLKLARNLLTDDGFIFVSIDINESENLKKLLDEIFGEQNFLAEFIWKKTSNPNSTGTNIGIEHEYILLYSKTHNFHLKLLPLNDDDLKKYTGKDDYFNVRGPYKLVNLNKTGTLNDLRPNLMYDIIAPDGSIIKPKPRWRWSKEKFEIGLSEDRIVFNKIKNSWTVSYKQYLYEDTDGKIIDRGNLIKTIFDDCGRTTDGTLEINKLLGKGVFDFPKPINLIKKLIYISSQNDDIILDFFSGSATTAHAVLKLNSEDSKNRRFIMIQIPENIDSKSNAFKNGYNTICEIGKDRIRRAGDKIVQESGNKDLDIGFKVFKLDSSNLNKWDPDYDDLEQTLLVSQDNIKPDRTQEDLIYEIMLKYGIDLTLPIEEYDTGENKIYSIGFGALLICLDNKITKDITDSIIELASEDVSRVVFKDNGFASDADKTNIKETLRTHNIDEFITI